jgi:hypothetical protein
MIGMQKGGPVPKGLKRGDYVMHPLAPKTLWIIKRIEKPNTAFLDYAGGYRLTEEERIAGFSLGGLYVNRRRWVCQIGDLERPNEMMVLGLIGSKE